MIDLLDKLNNNLSNNIVWTPVPPSVDEVEKDIYVTHMAIVKIEDFELQCYRCSNGDIAFDVEDIERFFRGCHLCDHPSRCPACNPSAEERKQPRMGLMVMEQD